MFGCPEAGKVCDPDFLADKAQVCADREGLGFGQEFGSGTFIGQKPQQTLLIRNGGADDLKIESVAVAGDPAFTFSYVPEVFPATISANKTFFIRAEFAPTAAKRYEAKVTVTSNAENSPVKEFVVSGCGVPADGGTSPCYRDGGI